MDYGDLSKKLVAKHFAKFGSFRSLCTYRVMGDATYDTTLRKVTPNILESHPGIYMIFTEFSFTAGMAPDKKFDDVPILSIDRLVIFPSDGITFTPEVGDIIVDSQFVMWEVKGISKDPKPSHFELHARPSGVTT